MRQGAARALALALGLAAAATALAQDPPKTDAAKPDPPKPDEPKKDAPPAPRAAGFTGTLDELASKFPQVVRLAEIGKSAGGRPLRVATVLGGGTASEKDAVWEALVVAGLDGEKARGDTVLAADLCAWMAERAAALPPGTAFRFLVDANPDASAARPRNDTATDDDQDGEQGEDAADDLDGDGKIAWMRLPDPAGGFAADDPKKPGEPQRAEPAKGRLGAWRIVPEGRDDDGDGLFNEDGPGGVDVARNFTIGFEEHVPAAGRWSASEKESRAVLDLLLADERIAVVYEIGGAETASAHADAAWTKLPDEDLKLLEGLRSSHAKGAPTQGERKPRAPGNGSLGAVTLHQLGRIWFGRAPLARTGAPWPADGATWPSPFLEWKAAPGTNVPAWTEIGVEVPPPPPPPKTDANTEPPKPDLTVFAETEAIADFLGAVAKGRAQLAFTDVRTSGDTGVLRIAARIANGGRLPTHTKRGADTKGRRPVNVRAVLPAGATLLAGEPHAQIERIDAGARSDEMRWVVRGNAGDTVRIECTSPDAGTTTLEAKIP